MARSGSQGRYVKIANAEYVGNEPAEEPAAENARSLVTHHRVWVGNDEEGWTEVPWVSDVDIPLRQGVPQKATITVMFPQVEITGRDEPKNT